MKRKLGLELYGPCSDTGAEPDRWGTVVTVDDNGRVKFHTVQSVARESKGSFVAGTVDGEAILSSECYLLYTSNSISKLKKTVRAMGKRMNKY